MFRFLLWLGLGYLFFRLLRGRPAVDNRGSSGASASRQGEKMVKCDVCGLYVPEHEALSGGWSDSGHHYCSPECQKKR